MAPADERGVRGDNIVDRYATLSDPSRKISPDITRLTGISEAMERDAPGYCRIAKLLIKWTISDSTGWQTSDTS